MSVEGHHQQAPRSVVCGVITVSDSRTEPTDTSGALIRELLTQAGHTVCASQIVKDEPDQIRDALARLAAEPACQAVLLSGGTGIAPRDRTPEAVAGILERRLDGFGELFRMLSFDEIGPAAMLSRAIAGVYRGRAIFCMPGSSNAVKLAMTRLILPELGHVVGELQRR